MSATMSAPPVAASRLPYDAPRCAHCHRPYYPRVSLYGGAFEVRAVYCRQCFNAMEAREYRGRWVTP